MKKLTNCLILLTLIAWTAASPSTAANITIKASNDCAVSSWVYGKDHNYNTNGLSAGASNTYEGLACSRSYVKFPLGAIPAGSTITYASVNLWFYSGYTPSSSADHSTYDLHYVPTDGWSEYNITWNNAPAYTGVLASKYLSFPPSGEYMNWVAWVILQNGTGWNYAADLADGQLSVLLKMTTEDSKSGAANIEDKEYAGGAYTPYLYVEYTPPKTKAKPLAFMLLLLLD